MRRRISRQDAKLAGRTLWFPAPLDVRSTGLANPRCSTLPPQMRTPVMENPSMVSRMSEFTPSGHKSKMRRTQAGWITTSPGCCWGCRSGDPLGQGRRQAPEWASGWSAFTAPPMSGRGKTDANLQPPGQSKCMIWEHTRNGARLLGLKAVLQKTRRLDRSPDIGDGNLLPDPC